MNPNNPGNHLNPTNPINPSPNPGLTPALSKGEGGMASKYFEFILNCDFLSKILNHTNHLNPNNNSSDNMLQTNT